MPSAKILIVEDDWIVASNIKNMLEEMEYVVPAIVSSGEQGIEKAGETEPDLILMDIMLKGEMDGIEAARIIRSEFNIPAVFLTAYADKEILDRVKTTEPLGYIIKPFEDRELLTAIELALYKHKMESRLRESEKLLSTTLRSIGDAVIATNNEACVNFINPVAESLTGWNREEAVGRPVGDIFRIINEDTGKEIESPVAKVLREDEVMGPANPALLIARDGTRIAIDDSATPMRDEDGNIIGAVMVFRDIREKRLAEAALRESEEKYREIVSNMPGAVYQFILNTDGSTSIPYVSEKVEDIFHVSVEEAMEEGSALYDLIYEGDLDSINGAVAESAKTLETLSTESRFRTKQGELKWGSATFTPHLLENGAVLFNGLFFDITERKQAEEALRDSAEKIKLFAYSVVHDLKNPTIALNLLTQALQSNYREVLDEKGKAYCEHILKASEQLAALVEKINIYIATKEVPLVIERTNLNEVLDDLRNEFSSSLTARQIGWSQAEIKTEINVDRVSILRALRNFVDNAMKYGGNELSYIRIGYEEFEEFYILSVKDDGIGIAKGDSERIFNIFQRSETSRDIYGAGLGLAIANEIACQHGGKVWVEPGLKKGANFYISISKNL